jgi:hypothetical protein
VTSKILNNWDAMKKIYAITAATLLAGAFGMQAADYTQNFDSMGTNGTAAPSGWSMFVSQSGDSTEAAYLTSAEMVTATNGSSTLAIWNQTDSPAEWLNQMANEGATPTSLNRLLGTSPTGSRGSLIQFNLNNTFGKPISIITLSYDMQTMAAGVLKSGFSPGAADELPGYSFYYLDGSTWVHFAPLDRTTTGTASGVFTLANPVAPGGTLQFRWFDDNAYAYSPDTMYAIDNVSITVPEPATLSLLEVGAVVLIAARRKG